MWAEAQDGGDPARKTDIRDLVQMQSAPFDQAPVTLAKLGSRYGGAYWANGDLALSGVRDAYFDGDFVPTNVYRYDKLEPGAEIVAPAIVEAPQTMEEVEKVPKLVKGPCLLNMVRGGKTPDIALADAERMGYAISILPGLLLGNIIAICDQTLAETKRLGKYPPPLVESSPAKTFARFGAADWDTRRTAFRDELKAAAE